MSSNQGYGMTWDKSGVAGNGTETIASLAKWDANGCRPRKVSITNDAVVNLLIRINIDSDAQWTLGPGENVVFDTISNGLQVEGVGATCAFRAHAEG